MEGPPGPRWCLPSAGCWTILAQRGIDMAWVFVNMLLSMAHESLAMVRPRIPNILSPTKQLPRHITWTLCQCHSACVAAMMSLACSSRLGSVKKPFIGTGDETTPACEADSIRHTNVQPHWKDITHNLGSNQRSSVGMAPSLSQGHLIHTFTLHLTSPHLVCPVNCFGARASCRFKPRQTSASLRRAPLAR